MNTSKSNNKYIAWKKKLELEPVAPPNYLEQKIINEYLNYKRKRRWKYYFLFIFFFVVLFVGIFFYLRFNNSRSFEQQFVQKEAFIAAIVVPSDTLVTEKQKRSEFFPNIKKKKILSFSIPLKRLSVRIIPKPTLMQFPILPEVPKSTKKDTLPSEQSKFIVQRRKIIKRRIPFIYWALRKIAKRHPKFPLQVIRKENNNYTYQFNLVVVKVQWNKKYAFNNK